MNTNTHTDPDDDDEVYEEQTMLALGQARRLEELISAALDAVLNGGTAVIAELEQAHAIATEVLESAGEVPGGTLTGRQLERLFRLAKDILHPDPAEPGAVDLSRELVENAGTARPARVVLAARHAAIDTPTHATVLYRLVNGFLNVGVAMRGQGNVLRVEQWFDTPAARLRAELWQLEDIRGPLADGEEELIQRGFIDTSDSSQPMAELWVRLDTPAPQLTS